MAQAPAPGSAGHDSVVNTLESSLISPQPRSGRSGVLQGAASHMLSDSSPRTQGYDKLGELPSRGGLYDGGSMPASSFIGMTDQERQALESSSTRAPSLAAATMTQSIGFRGWSASGPLQESAPSELPSLKRPETPILAYVDRASMPGFVDADERESRLQQFDRDLEYQELSTWTSPSTRGLADSSDKATSVDQWEAELLEWKRKYGCPDVSDPPAAAAATPADANTSSASSSAAAAPASQARPQAGTSGGPSSSAMPSQSSPPAGGPPQQFDQAAARSRVSFFEKYVSDSGRQESDPAQSPEAPGQSPEVQTAAPVSMEPSMALSGPPRQSMVDTDIDMAEMKRRSMAQRGSVAAQDIQRPEAPAEMERALPEASALDADIDCNDVKRKSMAQERRSVLPQDLERPAAPSETMEQPLPRGSVLDADIDMLEMKRRSMAQARHSVLPQDLERPGNPETAERELPMDSGLDDDIEAQEMKRRSMAHVAHERRSVLPEDLQRPATPERVIPEASLLDDDIDSQEMKRKSMAHVSHERRSVLPQDIERPDVPNMERQLPRASVLDADIDMHEMKRQSVAVGHAHERRSVLPHELARPRTPERGEESASQTVTGQVARAAEPVASNEATTAETSAALARAEAESQDLLQQVATFQTASSTVQGSTSRSADGASRSADALAGSGKSDLDKTNWTVVPVTTMVPQPPSTGRPAEERPPRSGGRRLEYTDRDLQLATESAKTRVKPDGTWRSEYSETGLQVRDFFTDIRKQREKDKGRQATGPLWVHMSTQAKNLANQFSLPELLEALKLFCSVRFDDYELYMRLLGEIPHYIKQATAPQLCELVRLLARRRLRERNYVDMVAAHLLQKIRSANDAVPARTLVKTANAFAALECRSNPKFVEHFLRHMEHRIEELDAELCCLVSSVFVANFMNDSLRRAYLNRCAETQAGFGGHLEDARCVACTELVLRKEHHSLVVSLPNYVIRYLDKVREHAKFDKFGTVTLPSASAPDGPKGSQRMDMNVSLQRKATTAAGGASADVFSSDMHRDVSACLTHLGIEHENGSLCGPYLLDIVALDMVTPTKRIVFEVNSPHHYYEGTQQLIAEKRLRHRMLGRLGHQLHMVNAEEWRPLSAAQKMTKMLKMSQDQQELNAKEEKIKAAANTMRAPLPALAIDSVKQSDPMKLKSISTLSAPIRVPVPPSQRARQAYDARYY